MKLRTWTAPVVLTLASVACESEPEPAPPPEPAPAEEPAPKAVEEPTCTYSYSAAGSSVQWTAYKLTERVGVGGTFKEVTVTGTHPATEPAKVFEHAKFQIATKGVDSENPERDAKIVAAFFGTLTDGESISGEVKELAEDKATLDLTLGGVTKPVELLYELSEEAVLTAKGKIDLSEFQGDKAVAALNKVCSVQHKGEGKESKLWPDVDLTVVSKLEKSCE